MLETKQIGAKIAEARKKNNSSQAELGQRLFISAQAVGKWERGESMPDITTLIRLAEVLHVDLNYFSAQFESYNRNSSSENQLESQQSDESAIKENKHLDWNMSSGNWVDADFSGLKNLNEKFSSANLKNCLFIGSEMAGIRLKNNNVDGCDFSQSNMNKSEIIGSNVINNNFGGCDLRQTEISTSHVKGCNFSSVDFAGARIQSCSLSKNKFEGTNWFKTSFSSSSFADLVLEGRIEDCSFQYCGFNKVKFQNATLINCFFKHNKRLSQVQFIDCKVDKITYAFLQNGKANLDGLIVIIP